MPIDTYWVKCTVCGIKYSVIASYSPELELCWRCSGWAKKLAEDAVDPGALGGG